MYEHIQNIKAEIEQHPVGSANWLALIAQLVALLNGLLNPPAQP